MMAANEQNPASPIKIFPWKQLARAGWYGCAAIALGIFILSVAVQMIAYEGALQGIPAVTEPSPWMYTVNIIGSVARMADSLIDLLLASVLFVKRPYEGMALFLSYFLLVSGVVLAGPLASLEPIWPSAGGFTYNLIMPVLFDPLLVAFLSIFPNGRFVPFWTRGLVVASLLYASLSPLLFYIEAFSGSEMLYMTRALLWFVLVFAGLYAQIHRYRRVSNPTERRQTKWVVYGFSVALLFAFLTTAQDFSLNRLGLDIPFPSWAPFSNLGWSLAIAVFPISLTFAVMRYRLYDIDILINRTLVYGALTGCVIVLYTLVVGAFGVLFQSGGNPFVDLLATGLVAVLFQPLRARLQRAVNRMMYGERDEPFTVLRRLGQRLENSDMPEDILTAIVQTISQALKLPYAEITLLREEKFECAARYGEEVDEMIRFPIHYQGQTVGYLNVASRVPGESFSQADERLLQQIARQAGPVAYNVQLTRDLRQSRARLVTTREEERRRLRRDLHDGLGPVLASQGLKIAAVSHLLDANPEKARKLLDELASQNEATVAEIRRLVYALRPPELDELGLVGAVRDYAAGLNGSLADERHLQVSIQQPERKLPGLPAAVEVAAYRIATEALTNVTRHARAHHGTVSFSLEEKGSEKVLQLEIVDDGVGISDNDKAGVGLNSMRERAEEVGGTLVFESAPQKGTRVEARFPLAI